MFDVSWADAYETSPHWSGWWEDTHQDGADWPAEVKLYQNRLYHRELLCVPERYAGMVVQALHRLVGHIGYERLLKDMERRYQFPPGFDRVGMAQDASRGCAVCQATQPPNWRKKGPIAMTPIPPG